MTTEAPQKKPLSSYVGFDSLPAQIEKKLVKKGFAFNLLVVGRSGLGKSTLVNTIFASHLVDPKTPGGQTTEIVNTSHVIEENGVSLKLSIVDTPVCGHVLT
jgi:septin family protein